MIAESGIHGRREGVAGSARGNCGVRVRARLCECAARDRLFINVDKQSEAQRRVTSRACCAVCLWQGGYYPENKSIVVRIC